MDWTGDASAFAGRAVDLKIIDPLPAEDLSAHVFDEIQFRPVREPSTAGLFGLGVLAVLLAAPAQASRSQTLSMRSISSSSSHPARSMPSRYPR